MSDLRSVTFIGGNYRQNAFNVNGVKFNTFIYGDFQFQDKELVEIYGSHRKY